MESIVKELNAKNLTEFLKKKVAMDLYQAAEILKTNPELLKQFEEAYAASNIAGEISDNFFDINAKQMSQMVDREAPITEEVESMIAKIVEDLVAETPIWRYNGKTAESVFDHG